MEQRIIGLDAYIAICKVYGLLLSPEQLDRLTMLVHSKLTPAQRRKVIRDLYS